MPTDILQYIPQRPPFVMIDTVSEPAGLVSGTYFTVTGDHILVSGGFLSEAGLVENMAQTAAAATGFRAQQEGTLPPVGFIGALKGLTIRELPRVGDTIHTEVNFAHQVMNASIVQGRVMLEGREIASCELKIFIQQ